jgi:hypothetical protein
MNWEKQRDEIGFTHWLAVDEVTVIKVEKSNGGDYFLTAMQNGDPCGGDVEYFNTLLEAKTFAEQIAINGEWKNYTL